MSDYGLHVKNSSGEIQIDSKYHNYAYYASGTYNVTSSGSHLISITATSSPVIVGLRTGIGGPPVVFNGLHKNASGNYDGIYIRTDEGYTGYVYWVAFTKPSNTTSSGYGLVVYNSSGEVVFSSEEKYLKVKAVHTGSWACPWDDTSEYSVTISNSSNYFIVVPYSTFVGSDYIPEEDEWYWHSYERGFYLYDSTTIRLCTVFVDSGTGEEQEDFWYDDFTVFEINYT